MDVAVIDLRRFRIRALLHHPPSTGRTKCEPQSRLSAIRIGGTQRTWAGTSFRSADDPQHWREHKRSTLATKRASTQLAELSGSWIASAIAAVFCAVATGMIGLRNGDVNALAIAPFGWGTVVVVADWLIQQLIPIPQPWGMLVAGTAVIAVQIAATWESDDDYTAVFTKGIVR